MEDKNSEKKLSDLKDPCTIDYYEPSSLTELKDGRIIYYTSKDDLIIVMFYKSSRS